jgi:hypothetical protein
VEVALASLYVILGHQLLRRRQFFCGCRLRFTLDHRLNVSLHRVQGCIVTFRMVTLMTESQVKWNSYQANHKQQP